MSTSYPSNLSDREWEYLQLHLPVQSKRGRPPIHSLRSIFDAIFYVLRTGCPRRYLPANFPPWQTVFYHFRRLRLKGTWTLLLRILHRAEHERQGRKPNPSAASIDSQSVKTVEESAGISGFDAHKHLTGRKRHILVDTLGTSPTEPAYLQLLLWWKTRIKQKDNPVKSIKQARLKRGDIVFRFHHLRFNLIKTGFQHQKDRLDRCYSYSIVYQIVSFAAFPNTS